MEEGKQKKSRKTDDEAEIGQRQFNSDSVLGRFLWLTKKNPPKNNFLLKKCKGQKNVKAILQ